MNIQRIATSLKRIAFIHTTKLVILVKSLRITTLPRPMRTRERQLNVFMFAAKNADVLQRI
ncbi:hypothetical protein AAA151_13060 [[Clostridium] innocuum]|nr:hypothetical protein [[Clostridium] innocuum]